MDLRVEEAIAVLQLELVCTCDWVFILFQFKLGIFCVRPKLCETCGPTVIWSYNSVCLHLRLIVC